MTEEGRKDELENAKEPEEIGTIESLADDEEAPIAEAVECFRIDATPDSLEDPERATELSETEKAESSFKNESPSSAVGASPMDGTEARIRKHSSSSDSNVGELNKAARSLDHCALDSGKLVVFQRYFHQPKMKFFVKPDNRRRHNAGNQPHHPGTHHPTEVKHPPEGETEDPLGYVRSYNSPPGPTLNQAGAVIGYPEKKQTAQELLDNENDCKRSLDLEHSLGSAETVPIDDVYAGNFSPVSERDRRDSISSAGISNIKVSSDESSVPSDSLPSAVRVSPLLSGSDSQEREKPRQRRFGLSDPVDIPDRSSGSRASSGSFPDNFKSVSQQSSLEFRPSVSNYINPTVLVKRKISKDSSTDNSHRSLSRESSVDLDMYMTEKPQTTSDNDIVSKLNKGSPSVDSCQPLIIPDFFVVDPSGNAQDLRLGFSKLMLTAPSVHESFASTSTNRTEIFGFHSSEASKDRRGDDSEGSKDRRGDDSEGSKDRRGDDSEGSKDRRGDDSEGSKDRRGDDSEGSKDRRGDDLNPTA